jgi:hypothetical protein
MRFFDSDVVYDMVLFFVYIFIITCAFAAFVGASVSSEHVVIAGVVSSVRGYGLDYIVVIDGMDFRGRFNVGFDDLSLLVGKSVVLEYWFNSEVKSSHTCGYVGVIREVI